MALIQGDLLKSFIWSVKVMSVFQSMPLKWNPEMSRFVLISARARKIQQYRLILAFIYFTLALLQIFYMWSESTRYVKTHGVMGTAGYVMSFVSTYLNCRRPKELVDIINDLIKFEENTYGMKINDLKITKSKVGSKNNDLLKREELKEEGINTERDRGTWLTKQMIQIQTFTAYASISYHIGVFTFPCYPMVVGSWIMDQCQLNTATGWQFELGKRLFVTLWSFSNFSFVLPGAVFHVVLMLLQGHCFKMHISHFESEVCDRQCKISEIPWHQYREIQVILAKYRLLYSQYLLNTVLVSNMVAQTACLIISLDFFRAGNNQSNDVSMLIVCAWCSALCGLTIMFFYGKLADVHSMSAGVLKNINTMIRFKKNKWIQRHLRSFPVLKIYLNYSNYVDREMPLTVEDFVVDQTTSFLLLE